jgi:hypothetical protein
MEHGGYRGWGMEVIGDGACGYRGWGMGDMEHMHGFMGYGGGGRLEHDGTWNIWGMGVDHGGT